jgi:acylphosphatase
VTVRKRILVSGRVQGVFFRDTCRRVADAGNVSGSAANLPDGRVEVIAEGENDAVDRLVEWCRSGPPYASVERVEVIDESPAGAEGFVIT